jgi:hypothetical protein
MFSATESSPFRKLRSCEHKVFSKHRYLSTIDKKTFPGNGICKTDLICESDWNENIVKNILHSKIKWIDRENLISQKLESEDYDG